MTSATRGWLNRRRWLGGGMGIVVESTFVVTPGSGRIVDG